MVEILRVYNYNEIRWVNKIVFSLVCVVLTLNIL